MSDGRDTSWNDGRGPQRRHQPTVDRGHGESQDQHGRWPDGAPAGPGGYPQQRPGPGGYAQAPREQYDERYGSNGYPPPAYDANGYPVQAYDANGYPVQAYDANGYPVQAYDANGYPIRVLDANGYDANGYDANGYDANGYDQYGYDANGYDANGYHANYGGPGAPGGADDDQTEAGPAVGPGYGAQGQPSTGYGAQGQPPPGYTGPGYPDPGYTDQGHAGPGYPGDGYADPRYPDPRYANPSYPDHGYPPPGHPEQGYAEPDRADPRFGQPGYPAGQPGPGFAGPGYVDPGYREQSYGDAGYGDAGYGDRGYGATGQPGYEPQQRYDDGSGGYPAGGFIERGFGSDNSGADPAVTTGGGGMRAVGRPPEFSDGDPRTTGGHRRVAAGSDDGFPPIPVGTQSKRRRGRTPIVLVIVIVLLAVVGVGGYWGIGKVRSYFGAPDYSGTGTSEIAKVKIVKGDSSTAIAQTLLTDGVIKSTKAFVKAATADPKSEGIEAGWYRLHKQMSAKSALEALEARDANGNPANLFVYKVTIPEGTISIDIYTLLSKQTGIPVSEFITAAKDPVALGVDKSWYTAKRDDNRPTVTAAEKGFKYPAMIEGFLFPATYNFQPDETAKEMLAEMVKKFNTVITSLDFKNRAQTKLGGIPPLEALIAASIAQKEATTPADMAGVTKVLYNRVFKGLANGLLGVDSETNYFLRMTGHDSKTSDKLKASELSNPNDPYNTHTVTGFPPGAISSPGEAALKAAVNPDPTKADYGYFQTVGTNPKVIFSKTYSEFCALNSSC